MPPRFQKTTLSNGIRVLSERHPESRALCLASTVAVGTRDEPKEFIGISHFLEHMVFKGSESRSAYQLVRSLESVGGEINAFTSREHTSYYTTTLSEDWKLAVDVLSDLTHRASFPEKEFAREKSVVLQEIGSSKDLLEEAIFDEAYERIYKDDPTGWPILGYPETLEAIDRPALQKYYQGMYCPSNIIVSAAGDIDHEKLVAQVEKRFDLSKAKNQFVESRKKPKARRVIHFVEKPSEQVHILIGIPTYSYKSPRRFDAYFLNMMLGGGMTSKLYQAVREKKGLVYSIYSQLQTYTDSGMLMIYAATEKSHAVKVLKEVTSVLKKVREQGISNRDLKLYKTQLRGSLIIGAEDIENRMNSIAVNEMIFNQYRPLDKILLEMDKITIESVNALIERDIKTKKMSALVMGPRFSDNEVQLMEELVDVES